MPTRVLLKEDDDIPDDAELLEMPARSLKSRLARHTKKELKERFGTDNPDEIKAKLDKLAEYEAEQERARVAALSEKEQLEERLRKAEERATRAETRALEVHNNQVVKETDRRISSIAKELVDGEFLEYELQRFAKHIDNCSEEELRDPDTLIRGYFQQRVQDKPKIAKGWGETTTETSAEAPSAAATPPAGNSQAQNAAPPPAKPPIQVKLTNGPNANPPAVQPGSGENLEKTAAPGRPNSMTDAEMREYKRRNNISW